MNDIGQDILTKAAQGDLQAFEAVYKASSGFVYNVVFRIVSNKEDAQEVTQEVFMTVYNKLKEFKFQSSFKTWVYRVATNHALNKLKQTSKLRDKTTVIDEQINPPAVAPDVEANIEKEHHNKLVDEFLNAINPDQRACVVLRNIEGLSYEEIAQSLNININTVRTRLKRAREKMLVLRKQVGYAQLQ